MPEWIIKHTDHLNNHAFIAHEGFYVSCTLANGINAAIGYAGLSTDRDYEHRHNLLHMDADQALAYVREHGRGTYELFSSEKSWVDRLDAHLKALRDMGCAVVVLTPEDIQMQRLGDDDEPTITYEQAETWLKFHHRDVEEAILGDYWGETVSAVLDFHPVGEKADA